MRPLVPIFRHRFGIAFPASNVLGDGLQTFLPPFLARPAAYLVLSLVIGVGGGYAIVPFLRAERDQKQFTSKAFRAHVKF